MEKERNLKKKPLRRSYKKSPRKTDSIWEEHSGAYKKEIAEEFGYSAMVIYLAMKHLEITCKKDNGVLRAGRAFILLSQ